MSPRGIALTVFIGSLIGIFAVYPEPQALAGLSVFSAFNAGFAWLLTRVGTELLAQLGFLHRNQS